MSIQSEADIFRRICKTHIIITPSRTIMANFRCLHLLVWKYPIYPIMSPHRRCLLSVFVPRAWSLPVCQQRHELARFRLKKILGGQFLIWMRNLIPNPTSDFPCRAVQVGCYSVSSNDEACDRGCRQIFWPKAGSNSGCHYELAVLRILAREIVAILAISIAGARRHRY